MPPWPAWPTIRLLAQFFISIPFSCGWSPSLVETSWKERVCVMDLLIFGLKEDDFQYGSDDGFGVALRHLKVLFGGETITEIQNESFLEKYPSFQLRPLKEPTFVNENGLQRVAVNLGAYSLHLRMDGFGGELRFYLDFPEGAVRNGVCLPEGRIFFTIPFWLQNEKFEQELNRLKETEAELEKLKDLYSKLEYDAGILQHTLRLSSMILLKDRISELMKLKFQQDSRLPSGSSKDILQGFGIMFSRVGSIQVKEVSAFPWKSKECYPSIGEIRLIQVMKH